MNRLALCLVFLPLLSLHAETVRIEHKQYKEAVDEFEKAHKLNPELFLAVYCTFKGFRPESPILRADARENRAVGMPAGEPA